MSNWKLLFAIPVAALLAFSLAQAQDANRGPGQGGPGGRGGPGGPGGPGQGPPNWEQMREMFMNNIKDQLGSTDDEWKVLKPKIEKVQTAQFATFAGFGPMGGMGGRRPGGPGGPGGGPGGPPGGAPGAGPGGANAPQESKMAKAARELRDALDNKATPATDITKKLTVYREAREKARAELQTARKDLSELLTPRQEAVLVVNFNILE